MKNKKEIDRGKVLPKDKRQMSEIGIDVDTFASMDTIPEKFMLELEDINREIVGMEWI